MKRIFEGAATALITPFCNGKIDYKSFENIIEFQMRDGISAFVVCGTTGEVSTLTLEEKKKLIAFTVEKTAGRVPVIAGTGGNNTQLACEMSKYAKAAGADAILSVAPYYNKGTRSGIIEHYKRIAQESELPVILYNVPGRTGVNLTPDIYRELSGTDGIYGVKEASGNIGNVLKTVSYCGDNFTLYSGNDSDTLSLMALGGKGVISVASNIIPERVNSMCKDYLDGHTDTALEKLKEMSELFDVLFCEVNPVPVKYAMSRLGLCKNELRLPLTSACVETETKIEKALKTLKLI